MKKLIALFIISAFLSIFSIAQAQPTITVQPRGRTNNVGDNARFFVTATGSGTLTYQWQFNGVDIAGATASTNNVSVTETNKAGNYRVLVSDSSGLTNTSSAAVLSVLYGDRTKITQWNFNSVTPDANDDTGTITASIGTGTVTQSGVSQNQWNDGSPADPAYAGGDNSSRRWNVLSQTVPNKTGGARFTVSTLGYKNIAVSGEQWNTARGSGYWRGQYSIDGGTNWIDRSLINLRTSVGIGWVYFSDDLSGVSGVANNANFQYRIVGERELSATGAGADAYVAADPSMTYNNSGLLGWDMVTVFGVVDEGAVSPVITGQPQSRTNNVGDNAQFSVLASGVGKLTYQWKFGSNNIAGATNSVLNIVITNASQAGAYSVVVNDSVGSVPSSQAILYLPAGNRKMITQWNFNSTTPDADVTTGVTTPSTGSGTMILTNVIANAWNTSSASDPASLGTDNSSRALQGPSQAVANKTGGPVFTVDTTYYKNISVSCEFLVFSATSAYWRGQYTTNGTDWVDRILINKRAQFLQTGNGTFAFCYDDLTGVEGVENNPNFAYRFVSEWESTATGSGSDAYVSLDPVQTYNQTGPFKIDMVTVLGNYLSDIPVILSQPHSATVPVGANVSFSVSVLGENPQYQWLLGSNNIFGATNSTLLLTNVQFADAGNYSVIVGNGNGSTNSLDAVLTVISQQISSGERYWIGGSGIWNASLANWGLSADGPFDRVWDNANLDSAVFGNAVQSGAISLAEAITVNKMTINNAAVTPAYSFTGANTLTFSGSNPEIFVGGTTNNSGTNSATISCVVAGSVVTKSGGGRLVLNNTSNSVQQWVVTGGAISSGGDVAAIFGSNQPPGLVSNFVTLDNGGLGFSSSSATSAIGTNRGIFLGSGGGQLGNNGTAGIITINGPITGPGDLRFPGVTEWPGQIQGDSATFIISNTNNNYGGWTHIATSEIRLGANQVFPATTTLNIINSTLSGRLNLNGFNQTVAKVILDSSTTGQSRIYDSVGTGSLSAGEFDLRRSAYVAAANVSAVLAGSGFMTKTTTGNITLSALNTYSGDTFLNNGTMTLNGVGRFGNGAGTLHLDGAQGLILTQTRTEENTLINPVVMTADIVFQSSTTATNDIILRHGGTWTTTGGTLYLFSPNALLTPPSPFTFELALTNSFVFTGPIDIGLGCKLNSLNLIGTEQTFSGGLSGAGTFRRSVGLSNGGRTIFGTENSYSGGTVIEAGSLLVNNLSGSGTGSGSVTVNGPSGVLGGTGFIAGNVVVNNGGSIAPGSSAGILTLQSGLNMTNGGTMIWELTALKDNSNGAAGTDFDQLVLTGGELELGGSSKLSLQFAAGMAPNAANAFWQATRSWTIVSLSGGLNTANASMASIVNGSYSAGNFSTAVSGGNIVLTFTPTAQTEPTITTQPQSRTNIVGTTASFTVAATGSEPFTYSWYRSTAQFVPIAGATNATFTIANVQAADVGSYFARVSNDLGTATSQTASLTLAPRPSLQPLTMTSGGTKAVIAWNTIAGAQYQLQYNTNLATTNWYLVTNIVGSGSSVSTTNTVPVGERQRYFRLNAQ